MKLFCYWDILALAERRTSFCHSFFLLPPYCRHFLFYFGHQRCLTQILFRKDQRCIVFLILTAVFDEAVVFVQCCYYCLTYSCYCDISFSFSQCLWQKDIFLPKWYLDRLSASRSSLVERFVSVFVVLVAVLLVSCCYFAICFCHRDIQFCFWLQGLLSQNDVFLCVDCFCGRSIVGMVLLFRSLIISHGHLAQPLTSGTSLAELHISICDVCFRGSSIFGLLLLFRHLFLPQFEIHLQKHWWVESILDDDGGR